MKQKTELYPADYIARRVRTQKIWSVITYGFAVLALAVCITLCALATTATEDRNELLVLLISGLAGCIVIFLWKNFVFESKRELKHIRTLQGDEPMAVQGKITLLPGRFRIPGSVFVQSIQIEQEDGSFASASINSKKAKLLPRTTAPITLYTVHGHVVAFEE